MGRYDSNDHGALPSRGAGPKPAAVRTPVLARFIAGRGPGLAASLARAGLRAAVSPPAISLAVVTVLPVFEDSTLAARRCVGESLLPPKFGATVPGYLCGFSASAPPS